MSTPPPPGATAPAGAAPAGAAAQQQPTGMTMETLLMKERELAAKSADLAKRDREVRLALASMAPNWPRKTCCMDPIVYHNINSEVPVDRTGFVRRCYYSYWAVFVFLIYNAVCALMPIIIANDKDKSTKDDEEKSWEVHFAVACVFLIGCFAAFFVWYFPIYQAVSTFEMGKYRMATSGCLLPSCLTCL